MSALPRPVIVPSRPLGRELVAALRRHDVEVAVEVDRLAPAADRPDHDAGILELRVPSHVDELGREAETRHRLA